MLSKLLFKSDRYQRLTQFLMGLFRPLFCFICVQLKKVFIDVVLGIRTQGHRMVGMEGSTEQWRSHWWLIKFSFIFD